MTVPNDKTYPTNATNKTWQAKKTAGDKLLTKTGLGDKLTAAETKWKAIPWNDLDITQTPITSLAGAQNKLRTAQAAELKVQAAITALTSAYDEARVTANTKGLSSGTKTAANNAVAALNDARTRLQHVSIQEFKDKVSELTLPVTLDDIEVHSAGDVVATAGSGKWAISKGELEIDHITWKVGDNAITGYKTKKVVVTGKHKDNSGFTNDMLLVTGSKTASAAKFKNVH
jgi:hypothetical protein